MGIKWGLDENRGSCEEWRFAEWLQRAEEREETSASARAADDQSLRLLFIQNNTLIYIDWSGSPETQSKNLQNLITSVSVAETRSHSWSGR